MNGWLESHLGKLQLLLCLLLLCLFARPLATGPLLLQALVLSAATTPLLPRWHRGRLLLLLELRVLGHFALDCADLVGLLAFSLFPFTSQGSSSPCHIDGSTDLVKGGAFAFLEESLVCAIICVKVSREGGILARRRRAWMLSAIG